MGIRNKRILKALRNLYQITIKKKPFEENRILAEKRFASFFGVRPIQHCALNVIVVAPRFVNPDTAGENLPLSFCDDPRLPQIDDINEIL